MYENKNYNPEMTEEIEEEILEQDNSFEEYEDPIESGALTVTEEVPEAPVEADTTPEETSEEVPVKTVTEEPKVSEKIGVVTGCNRLNVRKGPNTGNTPVVEVLNALDEVTILESGSTYAFYKVRTASGTEGFCMKKFITVK